MERRQVVSLAFALVAGASCYRSCAHRRRCRSSRTCVTFSKSGRRQFITGGKYVPYFLDGTDDQFTSSYPTGYAPDDWPEGPGIGIPFADEPYYRFSWRWDFLFKAKCTAGPRAGEILSTQQKFYRAAGHKQGSGSWKL